VTTRTGNTPDSASDNSGFRCAANANVTQPEQPAAQPTRLASSSPNKGGAKADSRQTANPSATANSRRGGNNNNNNNKPAGNTNTRANAKPTGKPHRHGGRRGRNEL